MCDNTDCNGKDDKNFHIVLRKEFDNDFCTWCQDCIKRDKDMILLTLPMNEYEKTINLLTDNIKVRKLINKNKIKKAYELLCEQYNNLYSELKVLDDLDVQNK